MVKRDARTDILNVDVEMFWQSNYHATNMNDLSRVAKVRKATVYQLNN